MKMPKVSTNLLKGQAAMQMLHTVTFTQNLSAESYSESTEFFFSWFSASVLILVWIWSVVVLDSVLSWSR